MTIYNKNRSWFATINKQSLQQMGFSEPETVDPEIIARHVKDRWERSGNNRKACVSVCESEAGLFHVHAYLYGQPTTFEFVQKLMLNSHVEAVASKSALADYITKEGDYSNSLEKILCVVGRENIVNVQGNRSDLDVIEEMVNQGMSAEEIMTVNIRYRRYEKMIRGACAQYKRKNSSRKRQITAYWHYGEYGSGIENVNDILCNKYGDEKVFYVTYASDGCLDFYDKMGFPKVLILDNIDKNTDFTLIKQILNPYTNTRMHARYEDITPYWDEVHFISFYSPEQYANRYKKEEELIKRLNEIVYHYEKDGINYDYNVPADAYESEAITKKYAEMGVVYGRLVEEGGIYYG